MANAKYLINFFKNEAVAGLDLNLPNYSKYATQFANMLESNSDLNNFAAYFKSVAFEDKDLMLETLEQDCDRADLATMLEELNMLTQDLQILKAKLEAQFNCKLSDQQFLEIVKNVMPTVYATA